MISIKHILLIAVVFFNIYAIAFSQNNINEDSTQNLKKYQAGELLIIAPKEQTNVIALPSSVTVIESDDIKRYNVKSIKNLTAMVPNYFMPDYGSKLTSPVYIRGIGSRINSPSIGLYVDNAPYFEKSAFDFNLFDIERIEVLRGPQGTLYGRNTMGGIINVFTKSPLYHEGTEFYATGGNYGYLNLGAAHYGSIAERFGYSANVNYLSENGYFTNAFSGEQVDELKNYSGRLRLLYQISEKFRIENIGSFERIKQGGYPYAVMNVATGIVGSVDYNQKGTYDRDLFTNALILNYNAGFATILSTTSFQYMLDKNSIDQDFTRDSVFFVVQDQKHTVYAQELIFKSPQKKNYEWVTGLYGFFQSFDDTVDVNSYKQKSVSIKDYLHDIYGAAVFHQSTMNNLFIENLSLVVGIRADWENDVLDYIFNTISNNVKKLNADTTYPGLNTFELMPKLSLKYQLKAGTNIYAAVSRGYKTGGFNSTFERPQDLTFEPEFSWNYEAGLKTMLFENIIYTDISVFYIDWSNQQIFQTVPSGRGSMLKNAGKSRSMGVELQLQAYPFDDFHTHLTFGYTNAKFVSYQKDSIVNFSNNYLPYIPNITMALQAVKTIRLGGEFFNSMDLTGAYNFVGEHFWNDENTRKQSAYGTIDFTVSIKSKIITADFWMKNILNEDYLAFYLSSTASGKLLNYAQKGKPQRFGLRITLKI